MAVRKAVFWLVLSAVFGFIGIKAYGVIRTRIPCFRCNIIVIVVDSLRANELPCYGYTLPTAPFLCEYAKNSVLFTNAYANATWTRPSNMSIITSLYPTSHGMVLPISESLNPNAITLPQVLAKNGYTTRFIANDQVHMGIELGYERIFRHIKLTDPTLSDDTLTTWYDAIDSIKKDNKEHRPSFTYFHTDHVHDYIDDILHIPESFPLDPKYTPPSLPTLNLFTSETWAFTKAYLPQSMHIYTIQSVIDRHKAWIQELNEAKTTDEAFEVFKRLPSDMREDIFRNMAERKLNSEHFTTIVPLYKHLYDNSIRTFDLAFAKILRRIKENGLDKNTIVIVVSDHGQMLGEHSLLGHILTMDDNEISIPFIIHAPGLPARTIDALTQQIDIFPTLLDLVGIPIPSSLQGISLKGAMMDERDAPLNTYVISHTTMPNEMYALITNRWKFMEAMYPNGTYRELFDRMKDPNEDHSIASDNEPVVERLTSLLHTTLDTKRVYPPIPSLLPYWQTEDERNTRLNVGTDK